MQESVNLEAQFVRHVCTEATKLKTISFLYLVKYGMYVDMCIL